MKLKFTLILIALFSLSTCKNGDGILEVETENNFIGKWEETFLWSSMHNEELERTSKLTFSENEFSVKISPPVRELVIIGDSIFTGWKNDTLYFGFYNIVKDTLKFIDVNNFSSNEYVFKFSNDTLSISCVAYNLNDSTLVAKLADVIWGFSTSKTSGKFFKTE
jgi:hypothetical protein